jgi:repressor LexA
MRPHKTEIDRLEINTLRCIGDFIDEHQYPPSVRDLKALLPISSTSVVNYRLERLEHFGLITRSPGLSRTIVITKQGRKVLNAQAKQEN